MSFCTYVCKKFIFYTNLVDFLKDVVVIVFHDVCSYVVSLSVWCNVAA